MLVGAYTAVCRVLPSAAFYREAAEAFLDAQVCEDQDANQMVRLQVFDSKDGSGRLVRRDLQDHLGLGLHWDAAYMACHLVLIGAASAVQVEDRSDVHSAVPCRELAHDCLPWASEDALVLQAASPDSQIPRPVLRLPVAHLAAADELLSALPGEDVQR